MKKAKSNYGNLVIFIVIAASVIALVMYYLQKPPSVMPVTQKTLSEDYSSRNQFIARVAVACPQNQDRPCAMDLLIQSPVT